MTLDSIKDYLDSLLNKAYPGYVCAIYDNKKAQTYKLKGGYTSFHESREEMTFNTFFDIASLTKIVGPTILACRYCYKGLLSFDDSIDKYFNNQYYKKVTIRNLLTHTGGFIPEIRLDEVLDNPEKAVSYILNQKPEYIPNSMVKYSCMGYIILGKILEKIGNNSLNILCKEEVFKPLGMNNITYNPLSKYSFAATEIIDNSIIPLNGIVHDENSRFLNGISGNAGLFTPIDDLLKFVKIFLNQDDLFLSQDIYYQLTHNMTNNIFQPRALGFNLVNKIDGEFFGSKVSDLAYGHTGFTGTSIVIDPKKEIGAILLTNRVNPTRKNKLLLNSRAKFHDLVFS